MTTESENNTDIPAAVWNEESKYWVVNTSLIVSAEWDEEEDTYVIDVTVPENGMDLRFKITNAGIHTTLYTEKLVEGDEVTGDGMYELNPIGEWNWSHVDWADFIYNDLHEETSETTV